jgi:stress-induced morphogen
MAKKHAKSEPRNRGTAKGPIGLKNKIESALRSEFPSDTIDVTDGYKGNVHILVVSRRFDGMNESAREQFLEEVIADSGVTAAQRGKISLLLAMSPGEIK